VKEDGRQQFFFQLILLFGNILISVSLFIIANKSEHPLKWLAFYTISQPLAHGRYGGYLKPSYLFLYLIPLLNIFFYIWLWMRISENTNKSQCSVSNDFSPSLMS